MVQIDARCVLADAQSAVGRGDTAARPRKPGRRHKTNRIESAAAQHLQAAGDAQSRFLAIECEEFALGRCQAECAHIVDEAPRAAMFVMSFSVQEDVGARVGALT